MARVEGFGGDEGDEAGERAGGGVFVASGEVGDDFGAGDIGVAGEEVAAHHVC